MAYYTPTTSTTTAGGDGEGEGEGMFVVADPYETLDMDTFFILSLIEKEHGGQGAKIDRTTIHDKCKEFLPESGLAFGTGEREGEDRSEDEDNTEKEKAEYRRSLVSHAIRSGYLIFAGRGRNTSTNDPDDDLFTIDLPFGERDPVTSMINRSDSSLLMVGGGNSSSGGGDGKNTTFPSAVVEAEGVGAGMGLPGRSSGGYELPVSPATTSVATSSDPETLTRDLEIALAAILKKHGPDCLVGKSMVDDYIRRLLPEKTVPQRKKMILHGIAAEYLIDGGETNKSNGTKRYRINLNPRYSVANRQEQQRSAEGTTEQQGQEETTGGIQVGDAQLYNRYRPLAPRLDDDVFNQVLEQFRDQKSPDSLLPGKEDALVSKLLELQLAEESEEEERRTAVSIADADAAAAVTGSTPTPLLTPAVSGGSTTTTTAGGGGARDERRFLDDKKDIIFWDYDNINQTRFGIGATAFVSTVMQFLMKKKLLGHRWECNAYLVNGVKYNELDIEQLLKAQVQCFLCSRKREAADREMERHIRQAAKDRKEIFNRIGSIIIISDDGDMIKTIKEVRDQFGCPVSVIHHAEGNHLDRFKLHAQYQFHIKEIFPPRSQESFPRSLSQQQKKELSAAAAPFHQQPQQNKKKAAPVVPAARALPPPAAPNDTTIVQVYVQSRNVGVRLNKLEINPASQRLVANPRESGSLCSDMRVHDASQCGKLHFKPQQSAQSAQLAPGSALHRFKMKDGSDSAVAATAADQVLANPASLFLILNPTYKGMWCTCDREDHNPSTCGFLHRLK